jgi:O-antigen/teichoic acid export membrane protein
MLRRLAKDSVVYAIPAVLGRAIGFLLFPFFAHALAPSEYGVLDVLTLVATLVGLTIALEVAQGLGRYFIDTDDQLTRRGFASTALWFTVAVYLGWTLVALLAAQPLAGWLLRGEADAGLLRVAIAWITANGLLYLLLNQLRWGLRPRAYAFVSGVNVVLTGVLSAALVLGAHTGVGGIVAAQLAAAAVAAGLAAWLLRGTYGLQFRRELLRPMLAFSLPLVPAGIGGFLLNFIDRGAIRARLTFADIGIYGAGYRLAAVVSLLMLGLQSALTPLVLTRYRELQTPAELARVFRIFVALAVALCAGLGLFADELFRVIAPPSYARGAGLVPILVPAAFFSGMYIFAPGLSIARRTAPIAVIAVASGILNTLLAFMLVGPAGLTGVAAGTLFSSAGGFVALMVLSQRAYPVPHRWPQLLAVAAAAAATIAGTRALTGGPLGGDALTVVLVKAGAVTVVSLLAGAALIDRAAFRVLLFRLYASR